MKVQFQAFDPFIKQLRSDKGWRVELEVSQSDYEAIAQLPAMQDRVLNVTIED